jgi:YVTN family beta-propeller protein
MHRLTENGVELELDLLPRGAEGADRPVREKEYVRVRVEVRDAETGRPITDEKPAAWIDHRKAEWSISETACQGRINGYLPKKMRTRPVVDLNGYVVLTLNRGNHISVLDPFFGFGSTNMLSVVSLPGEGADWVADESGRHVYVTIPKVNQVVDVRTGLWSVTDTAVVGTKPGRIRWGPDRDRLWISSDGGEKSGVSVLDPDGLEPLAHVATGQGRHEIAFRPDGRYAFVTNPGSGTVSVIDTESLDVARTLETGSHPVDLEYSDHRGHLYVVDDVDGTVMVYDGETLEPSTRISGAAGLWRIDFDNSGRWGFLLNRETDEVHVLDAEVDEVRHGLVSEGKPDQVHFTENFAYVRSLESSQVMMIGLRSLKPGEQAGSFARDFQGEGEVVTSETGVSAVHFPAGGMNPNRYGDPGIAQAMTLAPHERNALYVTNPPEKSVYFYHYMEGMPTPAGNLKTYRFEPKSAMTIGRDLSESAPGEFTATVRVDQAGKYSVNMVLDEPRVVHCFPFDVEKNPELAGTGRNVELKLEAATDRTLVAGQEQRLAFRIVERGTGDVRGDLEGVVARITSPTGWQRTLRAEPGEEGAYVAPVTVPEPGVYYLSARIDDLDKGYQDQHYLVLRAVGPDEVAASREGEDDG